MKPLKELVGKVHNQDCISVMKSLRAKSVQMIFADPPFNLNKKYNSYRDNLEFSEYMEWTEQWINQCCRVLKDDGSLFIYNIPKLLVYTAPILNDVMEFRHWIAWNSNGQPLGKTLQPAHYGILFYTKSRKSKFYDVRAPHPKCRKCGVHLKDYGGKEHLRHHFGYQVSDVWNDIHRVRHSSKRIDNHPCQLPVHLIERFILMTTDENDVVLDPFCGGGSAAVASKQMGRRYIGCDIDSHYAEVANKKYQEASSSKGINGEYVSVHLGKPVSMRHVDIMQ
ncbi:MAG: site-specific DNA-methyltransferase [Gammaproteobacteria bacterium]|nr:site-specific DNA-methyltransferase [Gammaproteobacteria bacterium]